MAEPEGLPEIKEITDLDTARLALRWALERIRDMHSRTSSLAQDNARLAAEVKRLGEESAAKEATLGNWRKTMAQWEETAGAYGRLAESTRAQVVQEIKSEHLRELALVEEQLRAARSELLREKGHCADIEKNLARAGVAAREEGRQEIFSLLEEQKKDFEAERQRLLAELKSLHAESASRSRTAAAREASLIEERARLTEEHSRRLAAMAEKWDAERREITAKFAQKISDLRRLMVARFELKPAGPPPAEPKKP